MINDWFGFTLQERRGIAAFILLCILVYCVGEFWPHKDFKEVEQSHYFVSNDSISHDTDDPNQNLNEMMWGVEKPIKKAAQKFRFDPNTISTDSLVLLGFSKFGAKSLTNFIAKGGKIYDETKFKSIYRIDTILVKELQGFISYPVKNTLTYSKSEKKEFVKTQELIIVELNTVDSITLDAIKGVGPYMVKRILQYRKRLGGYLYKEQLTELGVIADSLYQPIAEFVRVDPSKINKINLNTADYKVFTANPYFSKETTNAIIKYRKQHGPFTDVLHIRRIRSLKEEVGEKILPYLMVE
jgi:DNA uptake protein ComE-like DNA-binding protein